jgi:hypothetical protein
MPKGVVGGETSFNTRSGLKWQRKKVRKRAAVVVANKKTQKKRAKKELEKHAIKKGKISKDYFSKHKDGNGSR